MADEHPNAAMIRQLWEAYLRGDDLSPEQIYAEDFEWHVPGKKGLAGVYRGIQGLAELGEKTRRIAGDTMRLELIDVGGSDQRAYALVHTTASHGGEQHDNLECLVYRIRDGKIAEVRSFLYDLYANDEFWSSTDTA